MMDPGQKHLLRAYAVFAGSTLLGALVLPRHRVIGGAVGLVGSFYAIQYGGWGFYA